MVENWRVKVYYWFVMRTKNFHSVVWKEDNLYVARCLEVNVASQGKSHGEAIENLKEALELYFEDSEISIPQIKEVELQEVAV